MNDAHQIEMGTFTYGAVVSERLTVGDTVGLRIGPRQYATGPVEFADGESVTARIRYIGADRVTARILMQIDRAEFWADPDL